MSRQKDRDEFIALMTKEGVPVDVARLVMRHGATLHRIAEFECSSEAADRDRVRCPSASGRAFTSSCLCRDYGSYDSEHDNHGTVPRIAVKEGQVQRRLTELLGKYNIVPVFQGDPRGAVVKLKVPSGRTNDWGQTGICVP